MNDKLKGARRCSTHDERIRNQPGAAWRLVGIGCLGLALVWTCPSFAQDAVGQDTVAQDAAEAASHLSTAIQPDAETDGPQELARNEYSARQQATLEMWRRRDLSRDEVQAAARDSDPEVASRAQWILRQWRRGALPDTPADISRLLFRTDDPSAIEELLDAGQFSAAVVAIEESTGTADRDAVRDRVVKSLERRFPIYAIEALHRNTLADLLKLVDLVADSNALALTRLELMQILGVEFDDSTLLPESAEEWPEAKRVQTRIFLYMVLGRHEQAIQAAESSNNDDYLRLAQMLDDRWDDLAQASVVRARAAAPGSTESIRFWSDTLIAADRCGLDELRAEAMAALIAPDVQRDDETNLPNDPFRSSRQKSAFALRWKSLGVAGELDAALELLHTKDPDAAAMLAIASSRTSLAFEWIGGDDRACGVELSERIKEALLAQATSVDETLVPEMSNLLTRMRCYLSVGRNDLAWIIAEQLSRSPVHIGDTRIRENVLQQLATGFRNDWMIELAMLPGEDVLPAQSLSTIAKVLKDDDLGTLKTLIATYGALYPNMALRERFHAACRLINGETPHKWNPAVDYQRLYDELTMGKRRLQRVGGQAIIATTPQLNLNLVEMFGRHGESELATKALHQLVRLGDVRAAFQVAENQLAAGRATSAQSLYTSIYKAIAEQRSNRQSAIGATGTDLATKTVAAQWILAKRAGDIETQTRLNKELRVALCSPSFELRHKLAEYLQEHGEVDFASEINATLLPAAFAGADPAISFLNVAYFYGKSISESDVSKAWKWSSLGLCSNLVLTPFFTSWPTDIARWKLEQACEQHEPVAAQKHLQRLLRLNSLDIDTAERLFPKMKEAGMQEIVDTSLAQILDHGHEHLRKFPLDAMMFNNLAWVAAINQTQLEDAKQWSERAVFLVPDSVIYRDTLAEVLFRAGDVDQALSVEKACLLDDPGEWHLHEQIQRFEMPVANQ